MQIYRKYSEVLAKPGHMVASDFPRWQSADSREFHTIRRLGKGASGIVYETKRKRHGGRRFARKVFLETNSAVFEREAARLLHLRHENVVHHYCSFFDNRSCSLVMEIMQDDLHTLVHKRKDARWIKMINTLASPQSSRAIPNSALCTSEMTCPIMSGLEEAITEPEVTKKQEWNSSCGPFELLEAIDLMLQIAKGVKFLHENDLAHGDLKPDNILVNVDHATRGSNTGLTAKVADFGMIETKVWSMLRSCDAPHIGMVRWRAPEVFEFLPGHSRDVDNCDPYKALLQEYYKHDMGNDGEYAAESSSEDPILPEIFRDLSKLKMADVWSFGMTCAEILTGETPYSKCTLGHYRARLLRGERPELPPTCPRMLQELLQRCWSIDPGHRPTFCEIYQSLETLKQQTGFETSENVNESKPPPPEQSDHSDEDKKSPSFLQKAAKSVTHFGKQLTGSRIVRYLRPEKESTEPLKQQNLIEVC